MRSVCFQFHWMDSLWRLSSVLLPSWGCLSIPLNGFSTWLPESLNNRVNPFNSIEWIPGSATKPPGRSYASGFQFHWMDSGGRVRLGGWGWKKEIFQFHWMDSAQQYAGYARAARIYPFNSIEWIRRCHRVFSWLGFRLSIPLNGFLNPS